MFFPDSLNIFGSGDTDVFTRPFMITYQFAI